MFSHTANQLYQLFCKYIIHSLGKRSSILPLKQTLPIFWCPIHIQQNTLAWNPIIWFLDKILEAKAGKLNPNQLSFPGKSSAFFSHNGLKRHFQEKQQLPCPNFISGREIVRGVGLPIRSSRIYIRVFHISLLSASSILEWLLYSYPTLYASLWNNHHHNSCLAGGHRATSAVWWHLN